MKFTDNYIKMCERNPDVQEAWEPEDADWVGYKGDIELGIFPVDIFLQGQGSADTEFLIHEEIVEAGKKSAKKYYIHFPLQHQLQGMVMGGISNVRWWLRNLSRFAEENIPREEAAFEGLKVIAHADAQWSFEELWLAFVMKEKYGKVWKDGEWVTT